MNENDEFLNGTKRSKHKTRLRYEWDRVVRVERYTRNEDFKCVHCKAFVSADPMLSGVHNRNHCPYCLFSRHMDHFEPGDRLSACKSPMQPVGLTTKATRKKFGLAKYGELMLVHLCTECGKVSINRVAADDDADTVYTVFERSLSLSKAVAAKDVKLLGAEEGWLIKAQLFGVQAAESPLLAGA